MSCIYRYKQKYGKKCVNDILSDERYCKYHIIHRDKLYDDIDISLYNDKLDIFNLLYIFDKNDKLNFYNIIKYLTFKCEKTILKLYDKLNIIRMNIVKIQKIARNYIYRNISKYIKGSSENTEDPFTFDKIDDISLDLRYGFKDNYGHIYIFNLIKFEYFIRNNGNWNPYTKKELPYYVKNQVNLLIKYNRLDKKSIGEIKWNTPLQAYTDVSQLLEKNGFYNDVRWFLKFDLLICKKIISIFRNMSYDININNNFFPLGFELTKDGYVFEFCKEIMNMFMNADDHYLLCCNFIKAMAMYSEEFYNNLPSWLYYMDTMTSDGRIPYIYIYYQDVIDNQGDEILNNLNTPNLDNNHLDNNNSGNNTNIFRNLTRNILDGYINYNTSNSRYRIYYENLYNELYENQNLEINGVENELLGALNRFFDRI